MRCCLILLVPLAVSCGTREEVTSRVALPPGVAKPKGLRPDPPPSRPLTPPAAKIEHDSPSLPGETTIETAGNPSTPGVEGVCGYGEASVACWSGSGKPDATLTSRVRGAVASGQSHSTLPVVVGRKSRLAVVLTPAGNPDGSVQWSVSSAHPSDSSYSGASLGFAPDGRTRSLVLLTEDVRTTTSAVRFTERRRLPSEVPISLKVGASASLGGCRLTVSKIEKLGAQDEDRFFVRNRPSWRIVLLRSGKSANPEEFFPVDPFPMVLADGRRASLASLKAGKIVYAPKSAPTIQPIYYSELPKGAVAVLLDRDPANVERLTLGGSEVTNVVMNSVPLDPKF